MTVIFSQNEADFAVCVVKLTCKMCQVTTGSPLEVKVSNHCTAVKYIVAHPIIIHTQSKYFICLRCSQVCPIILFHL